MGKRVSVWRGYAQWTLCLQTLLSPPRRRRSPPSTPSLNAPRRALPRGRSRLASTWPEARALSMQEERLQGETGVQVPQRAGLRPGGQAPGDGMQTHEWPFPPAPDDTGPQPSMCSRMSRTELKTGGREPERTRRRAGCVLRASSARTGALHF